MFRRWWVWTLCDIKWQICVTNTVTLVSGVRYNNSHGLFALVNNLIDLREVDQSNVLEVFNLAG